MPAPHTPEYYLARAHAVHGNRYTYNVSTLRRSSALATIFCVDHGAFTQKLSNHLNGAGCPMCAGRGVDWLARFRSVHGDRYDYRHVHFAGYKTPVRILCAVHGEFSQTPDNHYRGAQGCPKCKGDRIRAVKQLSVHEFIRRASAVHKGRYTYATDQFSNLLTGEVTIFCPKHGPFTQSPVNHLAGKVGCTRCNHMKSAGEEAVLTFLSMFGAVEHRNRRLIAPKEVDIFMPGQRLAVEYCGVYYHSASSADEERALKRKHMDKYLACKAQGVRLITLFETEWHHRTYAVKRLLRNAVGKARGRLMARKCELRQPTLQEARAFYERYHPQGGAGSGEHYGLYWRGKLVACMRFTFGANDRGSAVANRAWTLTRYATRVSVAGGASRLFKAFLREHTPTEVKSFSDNRFFDGGMYTQLGFVLEEETPPDYQVWSPKIGLRPKAHYQRRLIPARLLEHKMDEVFDPDTDPRSESEMTYLMGARRIYDCGKKRWVWRRSN